MTLPRRYALPSTSTGQNVLEEMETLFPARRLPDKVRRTTYFDTFDWRLYRDGGMLVVQPDDGHWFLSWRSADGSVRHQHRTDRLPSFSSDFPAGDFRDAIAGVIEMRRLLPVVRVSSSGQSLALLDANHQMAVRVDVIQGTASPPEDDTRHEAFPVLLRVTPLVRAHPLYDQALSVVEGRLELRPQASNDMEAALQAIGARAGTYTSKLNVSLDPAMRAEDAVRTLHASMLDTIRMNEAGTKAGLDTEFLHDLRVAVRRIRTCLAQVKGIFPEARLEQVRDEFSWLGGITGPARDIDVYLENLDRYAGLLPAALRPDLEPLRRFLLDRQQEERKRLAAELESHRYSMLLLSFGQFLRESAPIHASAPNAGRPILDVATECIGRRFDRVVSRGDAITSSSPYIDLHSLRIDCKKLRYLLEFFRSLYDPGELEPLVDVLKKLQDNLGELNDLRVHREALRPFAEQMAATDSPPTRTLLTIGRLEERMKARQSRIRSRFSKRFSDFASRQTRERIERMLAVRQAPAGEPQP